MASKLPRAYTDVKVWGMMLNDALRTILHNETIYLSPTGTEPPTIKAGTKFFKYGTATDITPATPSTGNNVYPVSTSITYNASDVIFELADRTLTFGAGGLPSKSNSTLYYLYCSGSEDTDVTSQGKGVYNVGTSAPTYSLQQGGWYDGSNNKYIGMFYVNNVGVITDVIQLNSNVVGFAYLTSAGASISITVPTGLTYHNKFKALYSVGNSSTTTTSTVALQFNGLTTATNYRTSYLSRSNTTLALTSNNDNNIFAIITSGGTSSYGSGTIDLSIQNTNALITPHYHNYFIERYNSTVTTLNAIDSSGYYSGSSIAQITSVALAGTQNFRANSYMVLYKE